MAAHAPHWRAHEPGRGRSRSTRPRRSVRTGARGIGVDHRPQRAGRLSLGCRRYRALSQIRGRIGGARAGRHSGEWCPCCAAVVAGDPHRVDRVRAGHRPGRPRLGCKLGGDHALIDLDKATTDRMVMRFRTMAQDADVAIFYFSGHGRQLNGANYLLPIDIGPYTAATIGLQALNADLVVKAMEESRARLKIVLLDACRTPFKGPGGGLVSMQGPEGMVIGFATQPNNTAKQGPPGGNSPYAEALAYFMRVKGLEIFAFFNEVARKVRDATAKEQVPWVSYSAIEGPAYINPPEVMLAIRPTPPELQGYGHDDESSPPISSVRTSASLPFIQLAWKQLDNNEYAAARATLTKGIEADRNSAVAYSYRGFAWYLEGSTAKDRGTPMRRIVK